MEAGYLHQRENQELQAIARFKAAQIEDWLGERRQDLKSLVSTPFFARDVARWLEHGDPLAGERLSARLASLRIHENYSSVILLDRQGAPRLMFGLNRPATPEVAPAQLEKIAREPEPQLIDLHRDARGISLGYIFPTRSEAGEVIGFVTLFIDPTQRLYPLVQSWPTPSPSAETLIVRRDGNEVVFLNQLRHRQNTALDFRLPLDRVDLPAAAVLKEGEGIFAGSDYRGVKVLSYLRPVAGTSWGMVAKVDQDEVFADITRLAWTSAVGVLVAIAGCALLFVVLCRQQRLRTKLELEQGLTRIATLVPSVIHTLHLKADGIVCFPYASPSIQELYGFPAEELTVDASRVKARIHAEDLPRLEAGMADAARTGKLWHVEYRYDHPEKGEVWIERRCMPEYQSDGSIVWHGTLTDITRRKRDEKHLHLLAQVIERIAGAHDLPTLMFIVRSAVRELVGADGVSLVLRDGNQCHYADEDAIGPLWKGQRFPLEKCISGWTMLHAEATVIEDIYADPRIPHNAYRSTFVKSLAMVPIGRDQPVGAIGSYWAKRHLATEEEIGLQQALADAMAVGLANLELLKRLEAQQTSLEAEVAARTAQLTKANQELQAFTYAASHDLKAPMRGINCFSELLERKYQDRLDDEGRQFLHYVRQSASRMAVLIDDLLAYAQTEQQVRQPEPLNLRAAVRKIVAERESEIQRSGTEIRIDLPAAVVQADAEGLEQVLRNLIDNALKYASGSSPPVIEIGGEVASGKCRFWVRDNGIGFDMDYHDRIFEIFRRLHTYEEYHGSGVGLALVKKAVERMGGRIWAESVPCQGATFFVELPGQLRLAQ